MRNKKVIAIDTERVVLTFSPDIVAQQIEAMYRKRQLKLESLSFLLFLSHHKKISTSVLVVFSLFF